MKGEHPELLDHLHWLGHDSFRIDQPIVIYLDPWRLPPGSPAADLILVSHEHHDHCSPEDVERVRKDSTTVITNHTAAADLSPPVTVLQVGESMEVRGVTVEAIPAYNIGKPFHRKQAGHLGFVITLGEERLYFTGDADYIPEMDNIVCDVALLPVSGKYVMTAEEAAQAAEAIQPKVAIPMHYGAGVVGTKEDAERFRDLSPVPVVIMEVEAAG
ncbi:MAG: MBL fold metallo-hydrolase [Anaerolineales bacterium]|nr:MBL fold metallo-hydrolase [Anaerolineales bacterium]